MEDDYSIAAEKAGKASEAAHRRDIASLHNLAASHHRIAAEHARIMGHEEKAKEHSNMANMHCSAAYSATADEHPDTEEGGEELTGKQIHLGAKAHNEFKAGHNPPSWVEDEDKWDDAKTAASKTYDMDDDAYWPVVVHVYENMGGSVGKEAKAHMATGRLSTLAGRRMAENKELSASVKSNGFTSIKALQGAVAGICKGLPNAWVADLVTPPEGSEKWKAIVCSDGTPHSLRFKITSDHEVSQVGSPKALEQSQDLEFVAKLQAEAKARDSITEYAGSLDASKKAMDEFIKALKAGEYHGNQHQTKHEVAMEHSAAAHVSSRAANKQSRVAMKAEDAGEHKKAAAMHQSAADLHTSAAEKHMNAGNHDDADDHKEHAAKHVLRKAEHVAALDKLGSEGGEADETNSISTKAAKVEQGALQCRALDCAIEGANALRTGVPTIDNVLMYMPGGTHTISPSQDGRPVTVTVLVDETAAKRLEAQRAALERAGKRPFFSIQHETEIAAFWPTKFFWDNRIDATGSLAEGVYAEGEWTKSGRDAVEGKDFRTFSPTFFVDAVRNDPDRPVRIICNEKAKANMGALENDPAFQSISPLWARSSMTTTPVKLKAWVLECHEALQGYSNPTLEDVSMAVHNKYKIKLTEAQVASYLID